MLTVFSLVKKTLFIQEKLYKNATQEGMFKHNLARLLNDSAYPLGSQVS